VGHAQRRHPRVTDDPASDARPVQEVGEQAAELGRLAEQAQRRGSDRSRASFAVELSQHSADLRVGAELLQELPGRRTDARGSGRVPEHLRERNADRRNVAAADLDGQAREGRARTRRARPDPPARSARYASWAATAGLPRPPEPDAPAGLARLLAGDIVRLSIRSPEDGLRVLRDPETPPEQSTLALRALVNPPVPQVVWYVDGAPFQVADYPYTVRWRLAPGDHVFQARLIDGRTASSPVRVLVQ
jgi:hypothetical protein